MRRPPRPTGGATKDALQTLGALALLQLALPANLALTGVALVRLRLRPTPAAEPSSPAAKTVLLSGGKMTKALQLARSLHAAGHRVILVESEKYWLTGHRFSSAVDSFYTVPRPQDDGYAEALLDIVVREQVDVYIPVCSPAASFYDAQAKRVLAPHCEVLHADPDLVATLDDKEEFAALAHSLGLGVPESHRITDAAQVSDFNFAASEREFILKSIPYNPVHRLDLTLLPRSTPALTETFTQAKSISAAAPWVMQEFVAGQEYCTHATVRAGKVQVYCCCASSAFQVNYTSVDKPAIEAWVTHFVGELGLTGQVSFDFIEAEDGTVYAIECNPRTHSAITVFDGHPDLASAYLEADQPTIRPLPTSRPTYWIYHELWRMLAHPTRAPERMRVLGAGRDAIFDWSDPLPFLMVHHAQIPWLLVQNLRQGRRWLRIDFNIGKLVEPSGD